MNSANYSNWFIHHAHEMQGCGIWFRGSEINTLPPEDFDKRLFRFLLVRLSTYFDTGYSFTHQYLYQLAAENKDVYPDLCYLPPKNDGELFNKHQIPWLIGTQSKRVASDFDVIGFSNSITQELINIPHFLIKSQIPLKKSERLNRQDIPLIILGGANAMYSQSIWLDDPLVDGIFIGENNQAIEQIFSICVESKKLNCSKFETLNHLSEIPGFFIPNQKNRTKKSISLNLNEAKHLTAGTVYFLSDAIGTSHLQISEGCPCFCSFCAETWERRPYRERNAEMLKQTALEMKAQMGLDSIEIYSFNFNLHSELYQILWDIVPLFKNIGLKSQRFDLLAHDSEILEFQQVLDKNSLTCGLEGISPRLRQYLNKNLETQDLHKSLEAIFRINAIELKIFLIATGLEEEQDFAALADLLHHIKKIKIQCGAHTRIIFSMTPLVRFPWTPLEFANAHSMHTYQNIIKKCSSIVNNSGFEFRESSNLPEYWVSQILVRADQQSVSKAFVKTIVDTDFIYYREIPESFRWNFEKNLLHENLRVQGLLKGFTLEDSKKKPWVQIQSGVHRDYLWKQFQQIQSYKEIDYCLGRNWTQAKCQKCGGCPTPEHIQAIVLSEQKRKYGIDQFKQHRKESAETILPIVFLINLNKTSLGIPRKTIATALARSIMLAERQLIPYYKGYLKNYWDTQEQPCWVYGHDQLTLLWNEPALPRIEQLMRNEQFIQKTEDHFRNWGTLVEVSSSPWQPQKLTLISDAELYLTQYFKNNGLKHTLKKIKDDTYLFEFSKESLKKKIITQILYTKEHQTYKYELLLSSKFNISDFIKESKIHHRTSPYLSEIHCLK